MSERALLERFDLVADNSENIPMLRRYIVDLALRGKLLEKTDLDISATDMLKRIEAKADSLVKQGKLKKQKPLRPISAGEVPATYVAHCTFERLGNVANLQKGLTGIQSAISGQFPLVVTAAARSSCDHHDFDGEAAIVPMVSSTGHGNASLNRLHYQEGKFALGSILCAVFPIDEKLVSARFLFEYLTAFKHELLVSKMNGTANVTLTVGKIAEVPVPIIAPAVQRRVAEFMALCDQLEAAKNEREARRDRLVAASLHRIGTAIHSSTSSRVTGVEEGRASVLAEPVEALADAARFHLAHLPRFTTRPAHIKQLRQTILSLAMIGKLTDNGTGACSAREELEVVEKKKQDLAVRKKKAGAPISEDEQWCELPGGWIWARWDQITDWITYGFTRPMPHVKKGIPIVTGKNVNYGKIIFETADRTTEKAFAELNEKDCPQAGDILVTKDGSIGRSAIVDTHDSFCINQSVAVLWLRSCHFNRRFLQLAIDCPQTQQALLAKTEGVAIKHISVVDLGKMSFPLPPLVEQHRIVAKVDDLMALCDRLEGALTATQTESRLLLEATLADALSRNGEIRQEILQT